MSTSNRKFTGEVIREARVSKKMKRSDVALVLGVNEHTYDRIEKGRALPANHLIPILCELIELDPLLLHLCYVRDTGATDWTFKRIHQIRQICRSIT